MCPSRTDLSAFAAALAERLPGAWTSEYHRHTAYENQFPTVEGLWDAGHVDYIVSQYVLGHNAVLRGPHGQQLYVTDRPPVPPPVRGGPAGARGLQNPPDLPGA